MKHEDKWKHEWIALQVHEEDQYTQISSSENVNSHYNSIASGAHQTPNT